MFCDFTLKVQKMIDGVTSRVARTQLKYKFELNNEHSGRKRRKDRKRRRRRRDKRKPAE